MAEWRRASLREFVELQRGQSYKSAYLDEPGPWLLGLGTIARNGGFRGENLRRYGGPTPDRMLVRPGDIYVSLKDVTHAADLLGSVARFPDGLGPGRLTQDTIRLDVDDELIDRGYLYWLLRSPDYRAHCRNLGTGTTNLDLSREDFLRYSFMLPDRREQEAIATTLSAFDDKIVANARLSATADALARELFVAAAGESEATVLLADLASNSREVVQPAEAIGAYVGLEHVPRRRMWLEEIGDSGTVTSAKSQFRRGDVLFGKLRPYFHKVVSAPTDGVSSTDILVVRAHEPRLAGFVLAAVTSDALVERAVAASEGTRMPRASWKDLASWPVPWPGRDTALELSGRVAVLRDAVEARLRENVTLAATRDTLLPQLMSGKLRVREAAEMAGL
ncbi:restriction endonuclease subunit S [Cellulosimicrobium composti]|uniref:Restriction endonuclease subunit S n=1 Tax=Cellulosimicrobium composti TaxID=2672572 RepID=A0ABX0BF49_9MICO|nr:restriction endonuclease subunit S [Cellulosimicrobium composti]NDO89568.1 restriction endonuclease subunit S [Cellulosimicrobium composti]